MRMRKVLKTVSYWSTFDNLNASYHRSWVKSYYQSGVISPISVNWLVSFIGHSLNGSYHQSCVQSYCQSGVIIPISVNWLVSLIGHNLNGSYYQSWVKTYCNSLVRSLIGVNWLVGFTVMVLAVRLWLLKSVVSGQFCSVRFVCRVNVVKTSFLDGIGGH